MATYGVTQYGWPRHYGYDAMPAAVEDQRAIVGGPAPWMGSVTIPWRTACAAVWTVDPVTWANDTLLPLVGVGGQRAATLEQGRYQRETLTLTLNDPAAYLPGGAYASLIALGALLRVVWTVASPGGSLTVPSAVYSVQSCPSSDDDVRGGGPLTLTAVDHLQAFLRTEAFASGYATYGELSQNVEVALGTGMPAIGAANTYATLIAGQLWAASPPGLGIDPSWTPTREAPIGFDDPLFLQGIPFLVTQPGTPALWSDVLEYFWPYEPFRLTYDAAGLPMLRPGLARRDSGLVISRDATVGGVLAVPWERLTRTLRDASFTALTYNVIPQTPPAEGGTSIGGTFAQGGVAVSTSSVNPHRPGVTKHEIINDATPGASTAAYTDLNAYARHLLGIELGQSDQIVCEFDSAFPIAELGDEVRVSDEVKGINAWYQVTAVSQPHSEGPSSLTMVWVQDA